MARTSTTGSTVPRRQLGRYLRNARGHAGMTVRAAARHLEWSEAKMWRIETGQVPMRSHDVRLMCETYNVGPEHSEALVALSGETKAKGWWHAYGDVVPVTFDLYIGLEESASELRTYEAENVPGLLQTAEYARAVIEADNPDVGPQEIGRRVDVRLARQTIVTRPVAPTQLAVVLNEAVVRRPVGGARVMARQCRHLAEVSERAHVDLQIVPFAAGLHQGQLSGPFVILDFPTNGDGSQTEPPTVYVDGFTGSLYLDQPGEIARYERAFAAMREAAGLDADARARDILWQIAQEVD